jgi:hypothetical protein
VYGAIEGRRKKEEGRRKKEEGRRKKEDGRRKKEDGRRKTEERRRKTEEGRRKTEELTWDLGQLTIFNFLIENRKSFDSRSIEGAVLLAGINSPLYREDLSPRASDDFPHGCTLILLQSDRPNAISEATARQLMLRKC